jgi:dTDP-4-amino-4,6-dideoxygalactose transaminase
MIPLLDLTRQYQALKPELEKAALELLESCHYILGPSVAEFEENAARLLQVKHAIGVANGTDALQIALMAMGIGPGDEVITTPFSFFATAEVISMVGARPVFIDIDSTPYNLNPQLIESAINENTRAIIPVHLFGHAAAMDEINAIAKQHNLYVLEDAAQAWGAQLNNVPCGGLGDMGAFSFYPTKNLGACGEGGLITTNNDDLADKARTLRVHGQKGTYIHHEIGVNSRLQALQAVLLNVKLPHAQSWNDARRTHAAFYNEQFADLDIVLPVEAPGAYHVYHQYTIRSTRRDEVIEALKAQGVGCAIYYPKCLHLQPVYENLGYSEGSLPVAEKASDEVLSLPIFPELTENERQAVADAVRIALKN